MDNNELNSSPKKILFVTLKLSGGGAERVLLNLSAELNQFSNIEVKLFSFFKKGEYLKLIPAQLSVSYGCSRFNPFSIIRACWKLRRLCQTYDILIATQELWPSYLIALLSGNIKKKKRLCWVHINIIESLKYSFNDKNQIMRIIYPFLHKKMIQFCYPKFDKIIGVSRGVVESVSQVINLPLKSLTCIYNLIYFEQIKSLAQESFDLNRYHIKKPFILTTGRFVNQKAHSILIEAFAKIASQIPHDLVICGKGPLKSLYQKLAIELKIDDRVKIIDFLENPYPLMKEAELFVLSSSYEGLSVVLQEALSLGLPVISTNCPSGPNEILQGSSYEKLVPINNPLQLSQSILDFLKNNTGISINNTHLLEKYSEKNILPQWLTLFNQL